MRDFSDLTGTQWEMTSMIVATAEFPGSPGDFNLEIGTKSVSGRSDCNLWSADFLSGSDNDLTIENMISTEIACPPTSIEGPYFDLLMRISTFESVNKTLILRADNFDQIMYRQIES
ncbi:MAG: META domain-containing protein [Rhodothermales bacterium]|nr:META domain-containing protein [Rhodothermales bacterium]